jgi:3-oxoacyl-[acyl-carrier protein] reductase
VDLGIEGRVALVKGASKGIGRAIAHSLAREGARVAVTSRSRERIEQAAEELAAQTGGEVVAFEADNADLDRIAELPGEVAARLGPVDILVTNTGGPPPGGALAHGVEDWEAAYRTLVLAPKVLVDAVIPGMRERKWGRIVNVGSQTTLEPNPALNLSNAHRMATVGYFKTLATEVAGDGITVNTIATGRIATQRLSELSGLSLDEIEERAREEIPAGRLGRPEEYGDLVAFVASDRAGYLTGAQIPLDGGLLRSV